MKIIGNPNNSLLRDLLGPLYKVFLKSTEPHEFNFFSISPPYQLPIDEATIPLELCELYDAFF